MRTFSLFLLLLAITAVNMDWLYFPLSAPISAKQITLNLYAHYAFSLGLIFEIFIAFGVILLLSKKFTLSIIAINASLVVLLLLPSHIGLSHSDWLIAFLKQSEERSELYNLTLHYSVPNVNAEPMYSSVSRSNYQYIIDHINILINMLSIGWYLALISSISLLGVALYHSQFRFKLAMAVLISLGMWGVPVYQSALTLFKADDLQHAGDINLATGRTVDAAKQYAKAHEYYPALSFSTPFMTKAAETYAYKSKEKDTFTSIFDALKLINHENLLTHRASISSNDIISYNKARVLLDNINKGNTHITPMEKSLIGFTQHLISQLWLYQGLADYNSGNLNNALSALLHSNDHENNIATQFYIASTYIKLKKPDQAIQFLQPLLQKVSHASTRADIYCRIGDAYILAEQPDAARLAHSKCKDLDFISNYKVISILSGY